MQKRLAFRADTGSLGFFFTIEDWLSTIPIKVEITRCRFGLDQPWVPFDDDFEIPAEEQTIYAQCIERRSIEQMRLDHEAAKRARALPDQTECTICLQFLPDTDVATGMCGHSFHYECIDRWWYIHYTCPICRR
jgi:hypothetical protein